MSNDRDDWRKSANPHAWVTQEKFLEFMRVRKVPLTCELCGQDDKWWLDTGSEDGYVPRIPSMPTMQDGKAATADTFQMPVARLVCMYCGNIRLHALHALDLWRSIGEKPFRLAKDTGADGLTVVAEENGDNND